MYIYPALHSCEYVYAQGFTVSWPYTVYDFNGNPYGVYCHFNRDRTGLAFPTAGSLRRGFVNFTALRTDDSFVVFRIIKNDSVPYDTVIRPLENDTTFEFWINSDGGYTPVMNPDLGPYMYMRMVKSSKTTAAPSNVAGSSGYHGFLSGDRPIQYLSANGSDDHYFAFYSNPTSNMVSSNSKL